MGTIRPVPCILIALLAAAVAGILVPQLRREQLEIKDASEKDAAFAAAVERASAVRVLAAGERYSDGTYCSCPGPYPRTVLYETKDAADVREYGSMLKYRRFRSDQPDVAACSPLSIELLRGDDILHSFNVKGLKLTDESAAKVGAWLQTRDINAKLQAAREAYMAEKIK